MIQWSVLPSLQDAAQDISDRSEFQATAIFRQNDRNRSLASLLFTWTSRNTKTLERSKKFKRFKSVHIHQKTLFHYFLDKVLERTAAIELWFSCLFIEQNQISGAHLPSANRGLTSFSTADFSGAILTGATFAGCTGIPTGTPAAGMLPTCS